MTTQNGGDDFAAVVAHLEERQTAVSEVPGSNPGSTDDAVPMMLSPGGVSSRLQCQHTLRECYVEVSSPIG